MISSRTILLCLLAIIVVTAGCDRQTVPTAQQPTPPASPAPQSRPIVKMTLGGRVFEIEVADDEPSRRMGLMYRDSMPADRGMIFVFEDEIPRAFWMQNTRIPLDIIYLDHAGTVVSILPMKPYDLTDVPSGKPAQYAIELNQGVARALGLKVGDRVDLPAAVRSPAR